MKRPFFVITLLFVSLFISLASPSKAQAASCASQDGSCWLIIPPFGRCPNGGDLPNDDCAFIEQCCPNSPGNPNQQGINCINTHGSKGINTALGCVVIESGNDLVETILRIATGLGGGLALALILYGVFIVTTSAGMPDKLKAGSEIITSAVVGLIFILLSVFLVNLIGINILGIPGLT